MVMEISEYALWREMIVEKYEVLEGAWRTKNISMPYRCWLWRNILKGRKVQLFCSFKIMGMGGEKTFGSIGGVRTIL